MKNFCFSKDGLLDFIGGWVGGFRAFPRPGAIPGVVSELLVVAFEAIPYGPRQTVEL